MLCLKSCEQNEVRDFEFCSVNSSLKLFFFVCVVSDDLPIFRTKHVQSLFLKFHVKKVIIFLY